MAHEFAAEWRAATQTEIRGIQARGTAKEVPDTPDITKIPMKWVFLYKFDAHGFLTKFKARLCVRGDRQPCNDLDTYAATLAGTTFWVLMAIYARFDLETRQFDAVNTFTNSTLDETVYCHMSKGFRR